MKCLFCGDMINIDSDGGVTSPRSGSVHMRNLHFFEMLDFGTKPTRVVQIHPKFLMGQDYFGNFPDNLKKYTFFHHCWLKNYKNEKNNKTCFINFILLNSILIRFPLRCAGKILI